MVFLNVQVFKNHAHVIVQSAMTNIELQMVHLKLEPQSNIIKTVDLEGWGYYSRCPNPVQ